MNIQKYFISIRQFFVNNFCISIKSIEINKLFITNYILLFLIRLIPFYFIKTLKLRCIYLLDDIYFSNYSENLSINPLTISFDLSNGIEIISVKENLKKYNFSVPFWFFIKNEKLENYSIFKIKQFVQGKIISKEGFIEINKDKLIKDL